VTPKPPPHSPSVVFSRCKSQTIRKVPAPARVLASMAESLNPYRERNRVWPTAIRVTLLLLCLLSGFVPLGSANARPETRTGSFAQPALQFTIADFDSDGRPDLARVQVGQSSTQNTRYWIDFRLTSGFWRTVGVTAPAGGLQLRSADVNGDGFPDVVVSTFWANQPVTVLLNDGRGNFTQSDPSACPGAFTDSKSSLISGTDRIRDGVVELFSRYLPGECEECGRATILLTAVGRPITGTCFPAALLGSASFLSRAPPITTVRF
jgi:hypothetical protein